MEPISLWDRFREFVKASFTEKFKTFLPGCIVGFSMSKQLLFAGFSSEMVTVGTYVLKYIGTVLMAFGSGLATAYGAHLIKKLTTKKNDNERAA